MNKITLIITLVFAFATESCTKKEENQIENAPKVTALSTDTLTKDNDSIKSDISSENDLAENKDQLFDIEGNYLSKDNANCKMSLKLYYSEGKLKYDLKTEHKKITDFAILELNEKKDGYFITLKNIEWSENLGATDSDGNTTDKNLPLPKEIQGSLSKNEITIQNSGNAMNNYEKFSECGLKYINLIKIVK